MTVPNPIFTDNDLTNTGVWTLSGSPNEVPDVHSLSDVALDFDGVNDFIERIAGSLISTQTEFSISCWFKVDTLAQQGILFSQFVSGTQKQFIWRFEVDGRINIILFDTGGVATYTATTVATFKDNTWHHIVVTGKTGDVIKILVDGTLQAVTNTGSGFTGFGTTLAPFRGGMRGDGSNKLDGILARPRVWDVELATLEAIEEFDNETALRLSDSNFLSDDLGNASVWTYEGSADSNKVDDQCGTNTAIDFDGVDDALQRTLGSVITHGSEMSIAEMFNILNTTVQNTLLSQYTSSSVRTYFMRMEVSGKIFVIFYDSLGGSISRQTTNAYDDGALHQVVATFKDSINIFIDGLPVAMDAEVGSFSGVLGLGETPPLRLGIRGDGLNKMDGIGARPRIWTNELSASFVSDQYALELSCGQTGFTPEQINRASYILGSSPRIEA